MGIFFFFCHMLTWVKYFEVFLNIQSVCLLLLRVGGSAVPGEYHCHGELQTIYFCLCLIYISCSVFAMLALCN